MNKIPFLLLFIFMLVPVGLSEAQVATPDSSDLSVFIAPVTQSNGRVTLTASTNADDNSLGFSWSQIDNEAPAVRLQNTEKAIASFRIPFAVMEQTVTMSFSVSVTDGQDSATETIDVPVTLPVKPSMAIPPPESPSGFVETVLFEQQWDNTDGWTPDGQWSIESPMDTLFADTNNRVISIGECDGSCSLQAADEIKLSAYDGADLVFWVWFGDQILDTDSLNTEVVMVQARTADNWVDKYMITVGESVYEQWFPVSINFDEFAGDEFFFRFMPILENDNSIIQIDAIQLIAKIRDDVKPVISNVPNDIILDVFRPSIVTFTLPTAVDDVDGTVPVICDPPRRVIYPFGTTTVTCISQDSVGNTASASFDITLNKFVPLEITAPDDLILEATGELTLVDMGTASINRDATITNDAPDLFPLGSTVITWTAQDDKGDVANDTQIITIQDTTDPVIIPPNDIIHEATSLISMIQLGTATATDTVDAMPTITSDAPTSFPIGVTIITYTATDDSGNSATAIQNITIRDTGPMLVLPSDVTAEATGVLTTVDIGTATVTDNIDSLTAINDAPDSFPVGETMVTWTAKDSSENEVSAVQKVTIHDTTNPYFDTPESYNFYAEATGILTPLELDPIPANDIADPDVVVTNDAPDSFRLGSTPVIWMAKDSSGNTARYDQVVIINDRTSPIITAPDDIIIEADSLLTMIQLGVATATDLVDRAPLITSDAPTSFPIGVTIITYTATDISYNSATDTQRVTVQDTTGPMLILPSDVTSEATGVLTPLDIGTATVTDNVDSLTAINDAPDSFPVGETRVTWTAKDNAENVVTGIQTVIIRDTTQPTITVPDSIIAEATDELTSVDIGSATASDIADLDVTVTNDSPDSFPVGSTVITWTATDDSGNTASDTQTVRIQDTTRPVFTSFPEDITVTYLNRDTVEFETPTATDIFTVTILCDYDSDDSFPAGSTLVTCTATDANDNSVLDSFSVIVMPQVITLITPPDPVLDLSATDITSSSLRLEWTEPDLNGGTLQTYRLVMTSPHGDPQTLVGLTAEPFFEVIGLTHNTDYSFRVQARTDVGYSGGNVILDTTTLQDTTKPVFTSFPDDITVKSKNSISVEFETPTATDIFPVTVLCSNNSGDSFHVGSTLVICIATDANDNFVQDSFSVTVTVPVFETISDDFANLDSWNLGKSTGVSTVFFNNYILELTATDGNPAPSALMRGDGHGTFTGITRYISLENHNPDDPLYLSVDYRAQSSMTRYGATNVKLQLTDTHGHHLYQTRLIHGGTSDSGWRTFSTDISQYIAERDDVAVRLYFWDGSGGNWYHRLSIDNLYLGTDPPPSGNISGEADIQLTSLQELSLQISQYDQTQACRLIESLDESSDMYIDTQELIHAYNMTTIC